MCSAKLLSLDDVHLMEVNGCEFGFHVNTQYFRGPHLHRSPSQGQIRVILFLQFSDRERPQFIHRSDK